MRTSHVFELQGHRGARGLRPENTLPSFEIAFDLGVASIETDLHLSQDGVPILTHDPWISPNLHVGGSPDPSTRPAIASLSVAQLRGYRVSRNPDPERFPDQRAEVSPLAERFAAGRGIDVYTMPTLDDLFAFATSYVGEMGTAAGKTSAQQANVRRLRFDLELKHLPFRPEPGALQDAVVRVVQTAGMLGRVRVRSFDHRLVAAIRRLEPAIECGVLVAGTAPVRPLDLVRAADAQWYYPHYWFLDEIQVRDLHAEGVRVLPWTVNDLDDCRKLLDWNVDGITTDFPDRLVNADR